MGSRGAVRASDGGGGAIPAPRTTRQGLISATAAVAVAAALTFIPATRMGDAAPLVVGVGVIALLLIVGAVAIGVPALLGIALLLMLAAFQSTIVSDAVSIWAVVPAAAALYVVTELTLRSMALLRRGSGWSVMHGTDIGEIAVVAVGLATVTAIVLGLATELPVAQGILVRAAGVAATAAVVTLLWVLLRQRTA